MSIFYVFFGGYQSSQTDMELWLASACKLRDDVKFVAYPYPSSHASDVAAVAGFKKSVGFDTVIQKIKDAGADMLFIAGHSSGCAIANELNSLVEGDHKGITLIDLDGFVATHDQRKGSTVQVWSAEGGKGGQSVHWDSSHKMYPALHATKPWSLHFSLVNIAATDAITQDNYPQTGYAGCIANLYWLPPKKC